MRPRSDILATVHQFVGQASYAGAGHGVSLLDNEEVVEDIRLFLQKMLDVQ